MGTKKSLDTLRAEFKALEEQIKAAEAEEAAIKKAEEEKKRATLEIEKAASLAEIEECEKQLIKLYKAHLKKFGRIEINRSTSRDDSFSPFFKSHWFFNF